MSKENISFGTGSFVGEISRDHAFFDLPVREQAKIIGWANACPITDELTDPDNPNPGRGPEAMRQRYAEVNFWFNFIRRETESLSPHIWVDLTGNVARNEAEPVGKYEADNVPEWHDKEISPMGTLAGYALPRIFVEQLGTHKGITRKEMQDRLMRGLDVLQYAIVRGITGNDFLALVSEGLLQADCEPEEIMKHVFSAGWIEEHNAQEMMDNFKMIVNYRAPLLAQAYNSLSQEEKRQLKLA